MRCPDVTPRVAPAGSGGPAVRRIVVILALAVALALGASSAFAAPSALTPDPTAVTFSDHDIHDGNHQGVNVTFTNSSGTDATVSGVALTGPDAGEFTLGGDSCSGALVGGSGGQCQVMVQFAPTTPGVKSATLELSDDSGTADVALGGTGTTGTLSANPVTFQPQPTFYGDPQAQVNFFDSSPSQVRTTSWSFTGPDAARFYIQYGDNCLHQTFFSGNFCTTGIAMHAAPPGTYTAQLEVVNDGTASPLVIPLSVVELRGPHVAAPAQVAFGDVVVGQDAVQTVTIVNDGDTPLQLQQAFVVTGRPDVLFMSDDGCSPAPVAPGGSCQVAVHFRPAFPGPIDGPLFFILGNATQPVALVGLNGNGVAPAPAPAALTSEPTPPPAAIVAPTPTSSLPPTIGQSRRASVRVLGTAALGKALRCRPLGLPAGTAVRYTWLRGGRTVAGARSRILRITRDDVGARLSCRVTASGSEGAQLLVSSASARVRAGKAAGSR